MEAVNGVADGPPPPSPLTGCYLLIVLGEPHTGSHKDIILQRLAKGLLSWNVNDCLVDLEKELNIVTEQGLEGEEARYGERLIQFASENLVTEILIHPSVSTLAQCIRNLLSSFTRHRHIIHAGYTFAANGSWILQDGTFSLADFSEAFQEIDVQRVIRAYENGISFDIHCSPEGEWMKLPKDSFTRGCKLRVNPDDVLNSGSPAIANFVNYISPFLIPAELENILESSDVVGNIRFSRPTLYVFPGGQGDAALFGINGFNMLVDGGFSRKACFWDFVRHLDRLDAVMLTRLNNSNTNGIGAVLRRKAQNAVYPQIGHFFCNIQNRKSNLSPDGDKDKDPLVVNLLEEGQELISNLRSLELNPQVCYRDSEPINLYHKVGHGTLDMYVINPAKDSREVKEFLLRWNSNDQKLFANHKFSRECMLPLQNIVSICALLVWRPANPNDTITRILFPGSAPQNKIFEGLDRLKNLECIKHTVCTERTLAPPPKLKSKENILDKIVPPEKPKIEIKKSKPKQIPENKLIEDSLKNGLQNGHAEKVVRKSGSVESDKSESKPPKPKKEENKISESNKQEKIPKSKPDVNGSRVRPKPSEKKMSPPTPKKTIDSRKSELDKETTNQRVRSKISPSATPAKSTKDATNRRVLESKTRTAPKKEVKESKQPDKKDEVKKVERKPISRRPKADMKMPQSPVKRAINGSHKPDSISRKGKLDRDVTTDSSTVSTPSVDQDPLKKDLSKLTPEELQQLKAQELAELKEEQEAIKELEAVFRKGDKVTGESSDLRKVKDISIEDKTDTEEYLIVEKEIIEPTESKESEADGKEEETVKLARDSEESEKKKDDSEIKNDLDRHVDTEQEESGIGEQETDLEEGEDIQENEISKEPSVQSPEENKKITSKDDEIKEQALESQPDEKISANIESGATTTAPTLPEDERIPLNEIKEDTVDQIEEKHVKEETKEKETKEEVPVITFTTKTAESLAKIPSVVGIRLDKETRIRDIVKTPDEVADLPVHEEVDVEHLTEYSHERMKLKDEHYGDSPIRDEDLTSPRKSEDDKEEKEHVAAKEAENIIQEKDADVVKVEHKQDIKIAEEKDVSGIKEEGAVEKSPLHEEIDVHIETAESKPHNEMKVDSKEIESETFMPEKEMPAEAIIDEEKIDEDDEKDSNQHIKELTKPTEEMCKETVDKSLPRKESVQEKVFLGESEKEETKKEQHICDDDISKKKDAEKLTEDKVKEEIKEVDDEQKKSPLHETDLNSGKESEKDKSPSIEPQPQQTEVIGTKPLDKIGEVKTEKPNEEKDIKLNASQTFSSEQDSNEVKEDKQSESIVIGDTLDVTKKEKSRSPSPSEVEDQLIDKKLPEEEMSSNKQTEQEAKSLEEQKEQVPVEPSSTSKIEEKKIDISKEGEKSLKLSPEEQNKVDDIKENLVEKTDEIHDTKSPKSSSKVEEEIKQTTETEESKKHPIVEPVISMEDEAEALEAQERLPESSPKASEIEETDKIIGINQQPSESLTLKQQKEDEIKVEKLVSEPEVKHTTKEESDKQKALNEETIRLQDDLKIEENGVEGDSEKSIDDNEICEKHKISISKEDKEVTSHDVESKVQEEPVKVKSPTSSRKTSSDGKPGPIEAEELKDIKESQIKTEFKKSRSPSPSEIKEIKTPERKSSSVEEKSIPESISKVTVGILEEGIQSTNMKEDEHKKEDVVIEKESILEDIQSEVETCDLTTNETDKTSQKDEKKVEKAISDLNSKLISDDDSQTIKKEEMKPSTKDNEFEKSEKNIIEEENTIKERDQLAKTPEKIASDISKKEEDIELLKREGTEEHNISIEKRESVSGPTGQSIDTISKVYEEKPDTKKVIDDVELVCGTKPSAIDSTEQKTSGEEIAVPLTIGSEIKSDEKIIGEKTSISLPSTEHLQSAKTSVVSSSFILSDEDQKAIADKADVTLSATHIKVSETKQVSPSQEEKHPVEENFVKSPERKSSFKNEQLPEVLPVETKKSSTDESNLESPERKLITSEEIKEQELLSSDILKKIEIKSLEQIATNSEKEEIKPSPSEKEASTAQEPEKFKEDALDASKIEEEIMKHEIEKKSSIPNEKILPSECSEVVDKSKDVTSTEKNVEQVSTGKLEEESRRSQSPVKKAISPEICSETKSGKETEGHETSPIEHEESTNAIQDVKDKSPQNELKDQILSEEKKSSIEKIESTETFLTRKFSVIHSDKETTGTLIETEKEKSSTPITTDFKERSPDSISSAETSTTVTTEKETPQTSAETIRKESIHKDEEKLSTTTTLDKKELSVDSMSAVETSTLDTTDKETAQAPPKPARKDSIQKEEDKIIDSKEKKLDGISTAEETSTILPSDKETSQAPTTSEEKDSIDEIKDEPNIPDSKKKSVDGISPIGTCPSLSTDNKEISSVDTPVTTDKIEPLESTKSEQKDSIHEDKLDLSAPISPVNKSTEIIPEKEALPESKESERVDSIPEKKDELSTAITFDSKEKYADSTSPVETSSKVITDEKILQESASITIDTKEKAADVVSALETSTMVTTHEKILTKPEQKDSIHEEKVDLNATITNNFEDKSANDDSPQNKNTATDTDNKGKEISTDAISPAKTSTNVDINQEKPQKFAEDGKADSKKEHISELLETSEETCIKKDIISVKSSNVSIPDLTPCGTGDETVDINESITDELPEKKEKELLKEKPQGHDIVSPSVEEQEKSTEKISRTASPVGSDVKHVQELITEVERTPSPSSTQPNKEESSINEKINDDRKSQIEGLSSEEHQKAPEKEATSELKSTSPIQDTKQPSAGQEEMKKEIEIHEEKTDYSKDESPTQDKTVEKPIPQEKVYALEELDNKYAPVLTEQTEAKDINLNREFLPKKEDKIESVQEKKSDEKHLEEIEKIDVIEKQDHETAETEKGSTDKKHDEKKEICDSNEKVSSDVSNDARDQKSPTTVPLSEIHSFLEQEKIHSHKERGLTEEKFIGDVEVESKQQDHKPEKSIVDSDDKKIKSDEKSLDETQHEEGEKPQDKEQEQIKPLLDAKEEQEQIQDSKHEISKSEEHVMKTEKIKIDLTDKPEHAESVVLKSSPESPIINVVPSLPVLPTDIDKAELGRKSPKEREQDVAKIVASVATVLKSDAPLEEFHKQIPLYTTELRETHITTCDSPMSENDIEEELEKMERAEHKESKMLQNLESSIFVHDDNTKESSEDPEDSGTVHRMLVTASSEDGGEETEICPPGTIIFSRSSESSGRSSPENMSRKLSQSSSILDTISDQTTVKELTDGQSKKEAVVEEITKSSKGVLEGSVKSDTVAAHSTQSIYPDIDLTKEVKTLEDQIEQAVRKGEKEEKLSDEKKGDKPSDEKKEDKPSDENKEDKPSDEKKEEKLSDKKNEEKQSEVQEILSKTLQDVSKDAEDIKETITDKIGNVFGSIFSGASKVSEALGQTITDSVKAVETSIDDGLKKVETEIDEVKHKIEDVESKVVGTLVEEKQKAEHFVSDQLKESVSALSDTIDKTDKAKDSFVKQTEDTLDKMAAPLRETLGDALSNLAESLKHTEEKIEKPKPEEKQSDTKSSIHVQDPSENEITECILSSGGEITKQIYPSLKDDLEKADKVGNITDQEHKCHDTTTDPTKAKLMDDIKESSITSLISDATKDIEKVLEVDDIHISTEVSDKTVSDSKKGIETHTDPTLKNEKELTDKERKLSKDFDDKIVETAKTDFSGITQETNKIVGDVISDVEKSVNENGEQLKKEVENIVVESEEALINIKDGIENELAKLISDSKENIDDLGKSVEKKGDKLIETIEEKKEAGIKEAQTSIEHLVHDVKSSAGVVSDSLSNLIEKPVQSIATKEETHKDEKSELEHEKDSLLSRLETKAENMISSYTDEIKDTLKDATGNTEEDAKLSFETIKHDIDVEDVKKEIAKAAEEKDKLTNSLTSDISDIIRDEIKSLTGVEKSLEQEISSTTSNIVDSIKSAVDDTSHSLKEDTKTTLEEVGTTLATKSDMLVGKSKDEIEKKISELKAEVDGTKTAIIGKAESVSKDIADTKDKMEEALKETKESISKDITYTKDKVEEALNETKESLESSMSTIKQDLEKEKETLVTAGKEIEAEVKHAVGDVFDAGKKLFGGLFGSKKEDKKTKEAEPKLEKKESVESSILKDTSKVSDSDKSSPLEEIFKKCEIVDKGKCDLMGTLGLGKSGDISETCDISKGDVQTHLGLGASQEKKLSISDVEIFVDDKGKDSTTKCDLKTVDQKPDESKSEVNEKPHIKPEDSDINRLSSQEHEIDKHITDVPVKAESSKGDVQKDTSAADAHHYIEDVKSQIHHKISEQIDPMMMSFYGALPDDDDVLDDGDDTSGRSEVPLTHLHDLTKAKFEGKKFSTDAAPAQDPMTASFYGELPGGKDDKDPIGAWGKPLGLPSPAPPNEKGTPKKEKKLPSNVMAKNRINDDRARSESPSKNKKKINPVYVDLTYVPHHGNSNYAYVDFFKRVRARYYVFSGIEPSREVYNALLEAKQTWEDKDLEVTIIPTYDTDVLGYWVAENEELLTKYKIDLSPSASRCTINLQDHETSCSAYRLEF
ncbi:microtubule-associated protein futsch [Harmonia axyridis]|uniref:microtubule-associated protein futsch n=1 Tax=Harmonia axyridis TaxID=115357 RepID=UPI001E2775CE|nr:microtubule-associated protein futsch [Harmonia axyridis]